ncbi:MAG TPA: hypothetical protein VK172_14395 [Lentimicrobium sp.]|nr:hypothetical protein [Lentimicrobium sp.]
MQEHFNMEPLNLFNKEPFNIEPFKTQELVIRQTVAQVKKDFGMFGLDIDFPLDFNMVYDDLFRHVVYHIDRLLAGNLQKLAALMYQIDISEKTILEGWQEHPNYTKAEVITELLIYRELKKVLFRNYFKNYKLKNQPEP